MQFLVQSATQLCAWHALEEDESYFTLLKIAAVVQWRHWSKGSPPPPHLAHGLPSLGTVSVPNFFGTVVDGLRLPGHRVCLGRAGLMQANSEMKIYCCAAVAPLWTLSKPMADGLSSLAHRCFAQFGPPEGFRDAGIGIPMCALGTLRSASPRGRRPHRTLFGTLGDGFSPRLPFGQRVGGSCVGIPRTSSPCGTSSVPNSGSGRWSMGSVPPPAVCPREDMTIDDSG